MPRPPFQRDGFIGQKRKVNYLMRLVEGAVSLGKPIPNLLLCGAPGLGKSALVEMLAAVTKRGLRKITASSRLGLSALLLALRELKANAILLIDEGHALSGPLQLLVCGAVEDHRIPTMEKLPHGASAIATAYTDIPPFTLIVATDQPDLLSEALRSRLGPPVELTPYPTSEMREIVSRLCENETMTVSTHAVTLLAEASHGNPRRARQLVGTLAHYEPNRAVLIQRADVMAFLKESGVNEQLLDEQSQVYLVALLEAAGPVTPEAFAARLGRRRRWVKETEFFLFRKNLVTPTPKGRILTPEGRRQALRIQAEAAAEGGVDSAEGVTSMPSLEQPDESDRKEN